MGTYVSHVFLYGVKRSPSGQFFVKGGGDKGAGRLV